MNVPSRLRLVGFVAVLAGVGGLGPQAWGLDYWLEADAGLSAARTEERGGRASPTPGGSPGAAPAAVRGEERGLHLRVGEAFRPEEERPLVKERISRFDLYADQAKRRDLLAAGQEGQTPVAKLPPEASACLVVMDRKEWQSTMDAEKFNRYLTDEGQEAVLSQRAKAGQSGLEGREVYTRYLKALVPGQDSSSSLPNTFYKRRVGQRLEILLQNNPGRLQANRKLTVKVLFEGEPLPGAKVFAYRREASGAVVPGAAGAAGAAGANGGQGASAAGTMLTAVTSADGLADFKLEQNGEWLVRLVHITSGNERKVGANGAWESFWGSYSFVVKDAPGGVATPVKAANAPAGGGAGAGAGAAEEKKG